MQRLFFGNFDFEYQLRPTSGRRPPRPVVRLNEELACGWIAVADEGDLIWTPAPAEETFFDEAAACGLPRVEPFDDRETHRHGGAGRALPSNRAHEPRTPRDDLGDSPLELCPWGWTEGVRAWGGRNGWLCQAPPFAAVRRINSRRFSHELEGRWGVGLPEAVAIHSLDELGAAVRRLPRSCRRWVVKAEFSMSARERILGAGGELSEQAVNWTRKRLSEDGVVFVEPWVEKIEEAGLQFTVPQSGPPRLEGVTPLLTDATGVYRGSRFDPDPRIEANWSSAIETGLRVVEECRQNGYFGPLGIDAVRWRDIDGGEHLRPMQDINARWTMGRLSLGLRRLLGTGETGTWLHVRWPTDRPESPREAFEELANAQPPGTRVIRTSPFEVGGTAVGHGTLVVVSPPDRGIIESWRAI